MKPIFMFYFSTIFYLESVMSFILLDEVCIKYMIIFLVYSSFSLLLYLFLRTNWNNIQVRIQ